MSAAWRPGAGEKMPVLAALPDGDWIAALFNSNLAIGLAVATVILTLLSTRVRMSERMQEIAEQESAD